MEAKNKKEKCKHVEIKLSGNESLGTLYWFDLDLRVNVIGVDISEPTKRYLETKYMLLKKTAKE